MSDRNEQPGAGMRNVLLLISGAAVGATVAILTAPRSGRSTRRRIRHAAADLAEQASDLGRELERSIRNISQESLDLIQKGAEKGDQVVTEVRDSLVSRMESGRDLLSRQIDRINQRLAR